MAFKLNYKKNVHGKELTFDDAYLQVVCDYGDKVNRTASVVIYKDESKIEALSTIDYTFLASTDDGSENFIKQAYNYLKTLTEYSEVMDC